MVHCIKTFTQTLRNIQYFILRNSFGNFWSMHTGIRHLSYFRIWSFLFIVINFVWENGLIVMLLHRVFTSLENFFLYVPESSWWRWRFESSSSGVSSFIDSSNSLMICATSGPHISPESILTLQLYWQDLSHHRRIW